MIAKKVARFTLRILGELTAVNNFTLHKVNKESNEVLKRLGKTTLKLMLEGNEFVALSTKCLLNMTKQDIVNKGDPLLVETLVKILSELSEDSVDAANNVFELMYIVFQDREPKLKFSEQEILMHSLIRYLSTSDVAPKPLEFYKLLLDKDIQRAEMFDGVEILMSLLSTSTLEATVDLSSKCLISFLDHYTLDSKLLIGIIVQLSDITGNPHVSDCGLWSVIQILKFIIQRFIVSDVQNIYEVLILKLVVSEVNLESVTLKRGLSELIELVLSVTKIDKGNVWNSSLVSRLREQAFVLMSHESCNMQLAGLTICRHLLSVFKEAASKRLRKDGIKEVLQSFASSVKLNLDALFSDREIFKNIEMVGWKAVVSTHEDNSLVKTVFEQSDLATELISLYLMFDKSAGLVEVVDYVERSPDMGVHLAIINSIEQLTDASPSSLMSLVIYLLNILKRPSLELESSNYFETLNRLLARVHETEQDLIANVVKIIVTVCRTKMKGIGLSTVVLRRGLKILEHLSTQHSLKMVNDENLLEFMGWLGENAEVSKETQLSDLIERLKKNLEKIGGASLNKKLTLIQREVVKQKERRKEELRQLAVSDPKKYSN